MKDCCMKLNSLALGLSMGVIYAICVFVMGMMATHFDVGHDIVDLLADFYVGYGVGLVPSLIGSGWALLDGAFIGFFLSYFYNVFNKAIYCWCCCSKSKNKK